MTAVKKRAKAPKKAKPRQPKPHPMAYMREEGPCTNCGSEWHQPGFVFTKSGEMEDRVLCANIWCGVIERLKAERLLLAKLAAESPQFDNAIHAMEVRLFRDKLLAEEAARVNAR